MQRLLPFAAAALLHLSSSPEVTALAVAERLSGADYLERVRRSLPVARVHVADRARQRLHADAVRRAAQAKHTPTATERGLIDAAKRKRELRAERLRAIVRAGGMQGDSVSAPALALAA